ncbi:phosphatase PAP2 family protein, partial [bacterium]|nr:phosphatase PAP2 family protein [bacterium]
KHIKNKSLAGLINFVCATWILLVGLSRITLGVHYPSDVFTGYLLGIFFVCVTIKIDKLREE